jgi:hypothetical protein
VRQPLRPRRGRGRRRSELRTVARTSRDGLGRGDGHGCPGLGRRVAGRSRHRRGSLSATPVDPGPQRLGLGGVRRSCPLDRLLQQSEGVGGEGARGERAEPRPGRRRRRERPPAPGHRGEARTAGSRRVGERGGDEVEGAEGAPALQLRREKGFQHGDVQMGMGRGPAAIGAGHVTGQLGPRSGRHRPPPPSGTARRKRPRRGRRSAPQPTGRSPRRTARSGPSPPRSQAGRGCSRQPPAPLPPPVLPPPRQSPAAPPTPVRIAPGGARPSRCAGPDRQPGRRPRSGGGRSPRPGGCGPGRTPPGCAGRGSPGGRSLRSLGERLQQAAEAALRPPGALGDHRLDAEIFRQQAEDAARLAVGIALQDEAAGADERHRPRLSLRRACGHGGRRSTPRSPAPGDPPGAPPSGRRSATRRWSAR